MQERDPKAHRFLGLLHEVEENIDKAVECYKVKHLRLKYSLCTVKHMIPRVICIVNNSNIFYRCYENKHWYDNTINTD